MIPVKTVLFPDGTERKVQPLGMKRSTIKRIVELTKSDDSKLMDAIDFFFDLAIESLKGGGASDQEADDALESVPFGAEGMAFITQMLGIKL